MWCAAGAGAACTWAVPSGQGLKKGCAISQASMEQKPSNIGITRRPQSMAHTMLPLNGLDEERGGADSAKVDRVGPLLAGNGILHHLGFVVSSISAVAETFAVSMSARWDGVVTHDPIQRVRVAFFSPADVRIRSSSLWSQLARSRQSAISSKREEDCTTSVMKLTIWSPGYARQRV